GAAPPPSPGARLTAAVKAAPTVGFIWGDGPTGYSIRYAWRDAETDRPGRVVLITDRRLGEHTPAWPKIPAVQDAEFTVIEIRFAADGKGEGRASHTMPVAETSAQTLALDGYGQAPVLLEVTR